ncbi:MAG: hypothetical protein HS124_09270 [Anaerolineales bacterium]|nr:hypothetical protein [Anaerolineales bacterium]
MNVRAHFPDVNRIGVLTSTVLLVLALTRVARISDLSLEIQLPGFLLSLPFNLVAAMSLLTAGLAATGMDWLLRGHPLLGDRPTLQWWILPTLTTFVVGIFLALLPSGAAWRLGFVVSGVFLSLVFLAEYIVVDTGAPYYDLSLAGLTAISYTLFFILAAALRYGDLRLYLMLPALFVSAGFAGLRIFRLQFNRWEYAWSFGAAFVCAQLAAGLHYLPLSAVQFGLMLVGPLYGLTNFAVNMNEDASIRRAMLEPLIVVAICWGLALIVR